MRIRGVVIVAFLAMALAVLSSGCARARGCTQAGFLPGGIQRVAVAEVSGAIWGDPAKNQISDFFVEQLLKRGYKPVERRQIQSIINEQEFQQTEWTEPANAVEIGHIANVDALLLVNVAKATPDRIEMTAKMLDARDGTIIWVASGEGSTGRRLLAGVGAGVGAAAGWYIGGDEQGKEAGAIGGAVVGALGGAELAPEREAQARRAIREMLETLPARPGPDDN